MKKIFLMVLLLAVPGLAQARDGFGVAYGIYNLEYNEPGLTQSGRPNGGYISYFTDVSPYVGMELRYGVTGKSEKVYPATGNTLGFQMREFTSVLLKLMLPLSEGSRIYGTFGTTTATMERSSNVAVLNSMVSKTGLSYGGGVDFSMGTNLLLGAEWLSYWKNETVGTGMTFSFSGVNANIKMVF